MPVLESLLGNENVGKTRKQHFTINLTRRFRWLGVELDGQIEKQMKRWAALTVLLYAVALLLLTAPVLLDAFGDWGKNGPGISLQEIGAVYRHWGYWLWLGLLVAGQALLLLLPINIAERRLPARRPLKTPVIVGAFFLANLCFAGLASLLCAGFKEGGVIKDGGGLLFQYLNPFPLHQPDSGWHFFGGAIIIVVFFWIVWAFIFRRFAKSDDPNALLKRSTRWLLHGSILELLVAVPSHIIVRRRGDCCAPIGTFWGIVTGISVMLLCFGPGVFFLFVERCQRLQPKSPDAASQPAQK
jgi:hypothetical protein